MTFLAPDPGDFDIRLDAAHCFVVFDVLYFRTPMGSFNVCKEPLWRRKLYLDNIFKPTPTFTAEQLLDVACQPSIEVIDYKFTSSKDELKKVFKEVVEARGEGLVVKNPDSNYQLGLRQHTWIKLKPDFMDELGETVTCNVIGEFILPLWSPHRAELRAQEHTTASESEAVLLRRSSAPSGPGAGHSPSKESLGESLSPLQCFLLSEVTLQPPDLRQGERQLQPRTATLHLVRLALPQLLGVFADCFILRQRAH